MFAGTVREAVFSEPEVIRRVNTEFVPVSVKAALLHQAGSEAEGRLLRAIGRSAPAPQGICVLNADGQVLDWTLMFDNPQSVLDFLDHAAKRFAQHPDGTQPIATQRYMSFPGNKLANVTDPAKPQSLHKRHAAAERCPQKLRLPAGTLVARVRGRALDSDGKLSMSTTNQEHYAEDRFHVDAALQQKLAKVLAMDTKDPVKLPDDFAHLLVQHAYLGHLDVRPLRNPAGASSDLKQCELWARRDAHTPGLFRLAGQTAVEAEQKRRSDGAGFRHEVALTWEGVIELSGERITRLLLLARGTEHLKWNSMGSRGTNLVAHLPAGRPIDMNCGVRYGVIGEAAGTLAAE